MQPNRPTATDHQSTQLLRTLLAERATILATLAPEGWRASPLRRIFHPTAAQQYEQAVRMQENLKRLGSLFGKKGKTVKGEEKENLPPPARRILPRIRPTPGTLTTS